MTAQPGSCTFFDKTLRNLITYPGLSFWGAGNTLEPPWPTLPGSNMISAAEVKALNKLKDQDFHLGNFLAEADKTISMVESRARQIASAALAWRRRNPRLWPLVRQWERGRLPRHLWCKIPGSWLELQYGWIPLMSDVWGAVHHLQKSSKRDIPYVIVRSGLSDQAETVVSKPGRTLGAIASCTFKTDLRVNVQLVYKLNSPVLQELSSLGLINPAEILWELLPYSFVVDWFLPIGSWLGSLTGDVGFSFVTGSLSRKAKMVFGGSRITAVTSSPTVEVRTLTPPSWTGARETFVRTCYAGSPVPGLYVKNPLSLTHVANAMSLLVQAFR